MAIAVRNIQTENINQTGGITLSTYTVGPGAKALIVCTGVDQSDASHTITDVTFGGTALTKDVYIDGGRLVSIWRLDNPTATTGDIVATASGMPSSILWRSIIAFELTADSVVSVENTDAATTASGESLSTTVNSSASSLLISSLVSDSGSYSVTPSGISTIASVTLGIDNYVGTASGGASASADWSWTSAEPAAVASIAYTESATATVDDINTDENVDDGETGNVLTYSNFSSAITGVNIKSGAYSVACTSVTDLTGTASFSAPDISALIARTAGVPLTSASHSIAFEATDGTDTAEIAGTFTPKTGWAVQEITGAVKTTGSVFENFVGTIADGSQVYYPTASNTSIDATGIITTDSTTDIDMQYGEVDTGVWYWDQFTVIVEAGASGSLSGSDGIITPLTQPLVKPLIIGL